MWFRGKFRKCGFNSELGKGIFWKQWWQMVEPFQFCLLHGLGEELAAARLLGQVMSWCQQHEVSWWVVAGIAVFCYLSWVVSLKTVLSLWIFCWRQWCFPDHLLIFFKNINLLFSWTVLYCIVLFPWLLSHEWLSFAFSLVETDVGFFFFLCIEEVEVRKMSGF